MGFERLLFDRFASGTAVRVRHYSILETQTDVVDPLLASWTEFAGVLCVCGAVVELVVDRIRILCALTMLFGFQTGVEVAAIA